MHCKNFTANGTMRTKLRISEDKVPLKEYVERKLGQGESAMKIHCNLCVVSRNNRMPIQIVRQWHKYFHEERTKLHNLPKSCRPRTRISSFGNTQQIRNLLEEFPEILLTTKKFSIPPNFSK